MQVHFENLDIMNKKPLSLKVEDLYNKLCLTIVVVFVMN
ncbi:arylamine N-acetyltransferase [Paenibacillus sp. N1-5-1-14]|nr:arylamine N-acetyltransferase [Paenibacillus radicibacter]MCR8642703.1 arylamine N-acetyltransferase [Paenibacillus radicibacter]